MIVEDLTVRLGATNLTATDPLLKAIIAVSYLRYRDYHRGQKAIAWAEIYKDIKDSLGPNATSFELGLSMGLALATQTEVGNKA